MNRYQVLIAIGGVIASLLIPPLMLIADFFLYCFLITNFPALTPPRIWDSVLALISIFAGEALAAAIIVRFLYLARTKHIS